MQQKTTRFLLEAMSPCTESFFSKTYTYDSSGTCLNDSSGLIRQMEKCRKSMLEAVVWNEGIYVGGTWFDVTRQKWTAELLGTTWDTEKDCPVSDILSGHIEK